jgi:hypothetical protein
MPYITKPEADEHAPYYSTYIRLVGEDVFAQLESQARTTPRLLAGLTEDQGLHRYAAGKWSVKEVIGHMADAERVFAYRALRFGRADATELPGFDENAWVPAGGFDRRPVRELVGEFASVRGATLALLSSFDSDALLRRGTASGHPCSVRALAAIMAGHEAHHVAILRERYGVGS